MFEILLVAKYIQALKIPKYMKTKLSYCTFHGVEAHTDVDFESRYESCLKRYGIKKTKRARSLGNLDKKS